MKIACLCTNQAENRRDHWTSARSEGRHVINIGFGLGEMGHEVGIFSEAFVNRDKVWKNVSLYKFWDSTKHYDMLLCYNPYGGAFGRDSEVKDNYSYVFYVHWGQIPPKFPQQAIFQMCPKTRVICSGAYYGDLLQNDLNGVPIPNKRVPFEFLPALFPIPCYDKLTKQDFQDFNFDSSKKKLSVYASMATWGGFHYPKALFNVLSVLTDVLSYELDLTIMLDTPGNKFDADIIKKFNPKILYNHKDRSLTDRKNVAYSYLDILNIIHNSDLCITYGHESHRGASFLDIISLGKPTLYIAGANSNSKVNPYSYNELMKKIPEDCLYLDDTQEVLRDKITTQMNNLEYYYNRMKNCYIEYSFPVWSKIMDELLGKYCPGAK